MQDTIRLGKLSAFSASLADKRKDAINHRRLSGVEELWREDDEYYEGIDEANRTTSHMLKGASPDGRPVVVDKGISSTRSSVFVNITQPYVDMASARVADMLLPTDDKPFRIKPTPIPEVSKVKDSQELMPDGQIPIGEAAKAFLAEMDEKAEAAETQIWDWLVESRWHGEMRKVIEQSARIGTAVLKGPYPEKRMTRSVETTEAGVAFVIKEELKPASKWIDVNNLYPDPSCGDNIHNGRYIFELDTMSAKQLKDLKGAGFIDSEIDEAIKEGPNKRNTESNQFRPVKDSELYEVWYYHGYAEPDDLMAAGCECDPEASAMPVIVVMVNDRVIKASLSVFESGAFPYDVMVWQRVTGSWAGRGVARQVRTAQRMLNAASRNMMDNAGVSAGPQIVMKDGVIYPADGDWTITPLKIWRVDEGADVQQAAHAITSIVIPSLQAELSNIVKMALEFAERATSMPLLLQGQQGASSETVGGMQILQANASTVLRRIAKIVDDDVVEPHILRYYEWLMIYSPDDKIKGDCNIEALGSTAFYERDAQAQFAMQLLPMSTNPGFGLDPNKLMIEVLKANKISPERVRFTDEEIEQQKQAAQENPPVDPRIQGQLQVAQIKAQADMEKAKLVQSSDMEEINRKDAVMQSEFSLKLLMQQNEFEHQERMERMKYDMKMMELAQAQQISVDSIKAALSSDVMRLKTQKELSMMNHQAKQVSMPETEPVGQADAGHAYEQ